MGLRRSLSDVQEAAQLLGGKDMPTQLMETLFMGTPITKEWTVAVLNLSPFEGTYEMAMLEHRHTNTNMPKLLMMSASENLDIVRYTERAVAWHLLEVCKHMMYREALFIAIMQLNPCKRPIAAPVMTCEQWLARAE